jgi:EmrB/QacA subfamily drug resistance transporter
VTPIDDAETLARQRRTRITALIVACALFMQNLDSTVIATALPTMARDFGTAPVRMNVALTSYLLSLAVFIPASGWVADRFGARNVFRTAIAVFTVGSILCGRANSLEFLVFARIFQGIGGAMMVPVGRLLVLRTAPKSEMVAAMAWLTMPALIGPVVGPPLGGFIVTYVSWRWVFDINVPVGVLGMIFVSLFVTDVREVIKVRLDGWGLVLSGIAMAAVMVGLETIGRGMVEPWVTAGMLVAGVAAGIGYALHARTHPAPLLDFSLMRVPTFLVAVLAGTLFRVGVGAVPFLLPLMLQIGFGDSAADSGMVTFASSAGAMIMKPAAMSALRKFGFRDTLFWNSLISAILLVLCAAFRPSWPAAAIYAALLIGGFFRSLQFTAFNTVAYADVPREKMSAATSLYSTIQQVSVTLGVSMGAAVLTASMEFSGHSVPQLSDFSIAFIAVGICAVLSTPAVLLMPRNAAEEMSGHETHPEPRPQTGGGSARENPVLAQKSQ